MRIGRQGRKEPQGVQEATTELDQQVAKAVEELKALKASLVDVEVQLENVTGIPRNREAFREAVVRLSACTCAAGLPALRCCEDIVQLSL